MATTRIGSAARLLVASMLVSLVLAPGAHAKRVNVALTFGDDVLLAGDETLSLRARCLGNQSGIDKLSIYAVTSSNAVVRGADFYAGNGSYLTSGALPDASELTLLAVAAGAEVGGLFSDGGVYVLNLAAREGYAFASETTVMTLNLGGADCHFSADIQTIKKFKDAK